MSLPDKSLVSCNSQSRTLKARTLTVFEQSPLDRMMESLAPGGSWISSDASTEAKHHSTKQKYWIKMAAEADEGVVQSFNFRIILSTHKGDSNYKVMQNLRITAET